VGRSSESKFGVTGVPAGKLHQTRTSGPDVAPPPATLGPVHVRLSVPIACAAAIAVIGLVSACGGSPAPAQAFDPATANTTAHAAILSPTDFGAAWGSNKSDQFVDTATSSAIANTAACNAADAALTRAIGSRALGRAGRAEIRLAETLPTPTLAPATPGKTPAAAPPQTVAPTLEQTVEVYQDAAVPAAALPVIGAALTSTSYQQCNADIVKARFAKDFPNVKVVMTPFKPPAKVPGTGSFATAYSLAITAGIEKLSLDFQVYGWQTGNAIVTLTFSGTSDQLTPAFIQSALQKAEAKLAAAHAK